VVLGAAEQAAPFPYKRGRDMTDWETIAARLHFDEGKSWTETAAAVARFFPDLNQKQVWEKVRTRLRSTKQYKTRGKVTFEDRKDPTEQDVDAYFAQLISINNAAMRLEQKQNKATIGIADDKPILLIHWGDWHIGDKGVEYERLDEDATLIAETDGLYAIGQGDYKGNASALVHPQSTQEVIAPSDMQDRVVMRIVERTREKYIAMIRGCHDDWDKRLANKDFVQALCDICGAVNLWHGGIINLTVGEVEYRIGARHKYKNESGLNTTNTQRNFVNEFGHCDIVAVAHKHFCEMHQTERMGEKTIYLRSGSYKRYDEYGQKLAGYEGIYGVPGVILYPDRKEMLPVRDLRRAIDLLYKLRA
jgi:hypothetical protein